MLAVHELLLEFLLESQLKAAALVGLSAGIGTHMALAELQDCILSVQGWQGWVNHDDAAPFAQRTGAPACLIAQSWKSWKTSA